VRTLGIVETRFKRALSSNGLVVWRIAGVLRVDSGGTRLHVILAPNIYATASCTHVCVRCKEKIMQDHHIAPHLIRYEEMLCCYPVYIDILLIAGR
jgi:hypothetical protein